MIDRYTTGVDNVLVEYTPQISLQKICSIPFDAEDIKINIKKQFHPPQPSQPYLAELKTGIIEFVWCGLHLTDEEHIRDPFESPDLIP